MSTGGLLVRVQPEEPLHRKRPLSRSRVIGPCVSSVGDFMGSRDQAHLVNRWLWLADGVHSVECREQISLLGTNLVSIAGSPTDTVKGNAWDLTSAEMLRFFRRAVQLRLNLRGLGSSGRIGVEVESRDVLWCRRVLGLQLSLRLRKSNKNHLLARSGWRDADLHWRQPYVT